MDFREYQDKAKTTAQYPDLYDLLIPVLDKYDVATIAQNPLIVGTHEGQALFKKLCANPYYPALGLAGEVGEFCNKLKKVMRDKGGEIDREFLEFAEGELGDIQWYLAALCSELGLDLEKIAVKNLEKLASRKERGKIQGSGDNR